MDPRFNDIAAKPENDIFRVVFFPDRVYHAQYLNATRSPRYRYNVTEVRGKQDIIVLKGNVFLDGQFLSNFVRVEYRSSRLVEAARQRGRLAPEKLMAWIRLVPDDAASAEAMIKLHYCGWIDAYQVELWETLEAPANSMHDMSILDQMGHRAPITRIASFVAAMRDLKKLRRLELAFREDDRSAPSGFAISEPEWDNNYLSSHEEPVVPEPSSSQNTVPDKNYLIDFQRGFFLQAKDVKPVRYLNAMMDPGNPDITNDNVIEMRWLVQREFGGPVVFFHEVTIPPGKVEGTHWHIGSEELYYITEGVGIAYLGENDDPATERFDTVERDIYGVGRRRCKELPVEPGSVIFLKSGGIHGIRNNGPKPLKFVAFLYHSV
jgi:mannose-6-phosphate isomerase-like protein (cupin superfamily)